MWEAERGARERVEPTQQRRERVQGGAGLSRERVEEGEHRHRMVHASARVVTLRGVTRGGVIYYQTDKGRREEKGRSVHSIT